MSAPVKERPVVQGSHYSASPDRRTSALREYVEYVRRHSPDRVPKLEAFLESYDIVGVSSKTLPIPYGDHLATFRCANGTRVYTSQPYHRFPDGDHLTAYVRFAREYRLSGSVGWNEAWWDAKACLVTFMTEPSPGKDLYYLKHEIAALFPRIEECMELNRHDPEAARRLISAVIKDGKHLRQRLQKALVEAGQTTGNGGAL